MGPGGILYPPYLQTLFNIIIDTQISHHLSEAYKSALFIGSLWQLCVIKHEASLQSVTAVLQALKKWLLKYEKVYISSWK